VTLLPELRRFHHARPEEQRLRQLIFVTPGLQAAFDVNLLALRQIVGEILLSPKNDVVPVGFFLPLPALLVLPAAAGRNCKTRPSSTARGKSGLGVSAKVANENDFIDASGCHIFHALYHTWLMQTISPGTGSGYSAPADKVPPKALAGVFAVSRS
jgi:hypothetical protein